MKRPYLTPEQRAARNAARVAQKQADLPFYEEKLAQMRSLLTEARTDDVPHLGTIRLLEDTVQMFERDVAEREAQLNRKEEAK